MKFKTNEQLMLYRWHVRFGTSKKALADAIGVSNTTINNIMQGRRFGFETKYKIDEFLKKNEDMVEFLK
ncbi:helix-turn-helix domain-containing protein [Lentilactobacillus kefiri]|uniref:helix-turn-helix domain-containing protein n=1 Tax=Lentilactobacillus kefiri TaxID=33962 RepID=UPI002072AB1C|nr:helix-turn-helix transcriptional regulator [Lentilactobacillus kefiri]